MKKYLVVTSVGELTPKLNVKYTTKIEHFVTDFPS